MFILNVYIYMHTMYHGCVIHLLSIFSKWNMEYTQFDCWDAQVEGFNLREVMVLWLGRGAYRYQFFGDREVEDFARRLNSDWPERRRMPDYLAVSSIDQRQLGQISLRVASVSLIDSWGGGKTRKAKSEISQTQEAFLSFSSLSLFLSPSLLFTSLC